MMPSFVSHVRASLYVSFVVCFIALSIKVKNDSYRIDVLVGREMTLNLKSLDFEKRIEECEIKLRVLKIMNHMDLMEEKEKQDRRNDPPIPQRKARLVEPPGVAQWTF